MITLSGVYCLFCVQAAGAKAKGEHCPSKKASESAHCDFSKKKASQTSQTAARLNALECCAPKFNFFVAKLEKNEVPQQTPALANNFFGFLPAVKREDKAGADASTYRAPLDDNRDLRVRICVFRI